VDQSPLKNAELQSKVLQHERKTAIQAKGINLDHLIGTVAASLHVDSDQLTLCFQ
jgi:hypothetical protein